MFFQNFLQNSFLYSLVIFLSVLLIFAVTLYWNRGLASVLRNWFTLSIIGFCVFAFAYNLRYSLAEPNDSNITPFPNSFPTTTSTHVPVRLYSELILKDVGQLDASGIDWGQLSAQTSIDFATDYSLATQCSDVANQIEGVPIVVTMGLTQPIESPVAVHILFRGGNVFETYRFRDAGHLALHFESLDGNRSYTLKHDIVPGRNLVDWQNDNDSTEEERRNIETVSEQIQLFEMGEKGGTLSHWMGLETIDVVDVSEQFLGEGYRLTTIELRDSSFELLDDTSPCIYLQALTVEHAQPAIRGPVSLVHASAPIINMASALSFTHETQIKEMLRAELESQYGDRWEKILGEPLESTVLVNLSYQEFQQGFLIWLEHEFESGQGVYWPIWAVQRSDGMQIGTGWQEYADFLSSDPVSCEGIQGEELLVGGFRKLYCVTPEVRELLGTPLKVEEITGAAKTAAIFYEHGTIFFVPKRNEIWLLQSEGNRWFVFDHSN